MIPSPAGNSLETRRSLHDRARACSLKRSEPATSEAHENPPPKRIPEDRDLHALTAIPRSTIHGLAGETHSQVLRYFGPVDILAYAEALAPGLPRPPEAIAAELCLQIAADPSVYALGRHVRMAAWVPAAFRHQPLDDILNRLLKRSECTAHERRVLAVARDCVGAAQGLMARRTDALAGIARRIEWRIGMRNVRSLAQFDALFAHLGGLPRGDLRVALLEGLDALRRLARQDPRPNRWTAELEARVVACVDGADLLAPAERAVIIHAGFVLADQAERQTPAAWTALPRRLQEKLRHLPLHLLYQALPPQEEQFFNTVSDMLREKPAEEKGAWFGLLIDAMPARCPERGVALLNLSAVLQSLPAEDVLPNLERLAQATIQPEVNRDMRDEILFELVGPDTLQAIPAARRKSALRILLNAMDGAQLTHDEQEPLIQEMLDRLVLVPQEDRNELLGAILDLP